MTENLETGEILQTEHLELLETAHESLELVVEKELRFRHADKLFHSPDHTLGNENAEIASGVAKIAKRFALLLQEKMPVSLGLNNQSKLEEYEAFKLGLEGGALAHDVIMEIDGVSETGMVQRRRGWQEGKNEFESARWFVEQVGITDDNRYYDTYINTGVSAIAATDPDEMNFSARISDTSKLEGLSADAVGLLTDPDSHEIVYVHIGSSKAAAGLEALFASTADLAAATEPDLFYSTGNQEFFELHYGVSKDCVAFINDSQSLTRGRVLEILKTMRGWRKVQVGVAFGQLLRLEKNFTSQNITELFLSTFGSNPDNEEVEAFVSEVLKMAEGMRGSVESSTEYWKQFSKIEIAEDGPDMLSDKESIVFSDALSLMQGDVFDLHAYTKHVEQELEKLDLTNY